MADTIKEMTPPCLCTYMPSLWLRTWPSSSPTGFEKITNRPLSKARAGSHRLDHPTPRETRLCDQGVRQCAAMA